MPRWQRNVNVKTVASPSFVKKGQPKKNDEAPRGPRASAGLTVSVLIVRLTWEVCKVCLW